MGVDVDMEGGHIKIVTTKGSIIKPSDHKFRKEVLSNNISQREYEEVSDDDWVDRRDWLTLMVKWFVNWIKLTNYEWKYLIKGDSKKLMFFEIENASLT